MKGSAGGQGGTNSARPSTSTPTFLAHFPHTLLFLLPLSWQYWGLDLTAVFMQGQCFTLTELKPQQSSDDIHWHGGFGLLSAY